MEVGLRNSLVSVGCAVLISFSVSYFTSAQEQVILTERVSQNKATIDQVDVRLQKHNDDSNKMMIKNSKDIALIVQAVGALSESLEKYTAESNRRSEQTTSSVQKLHDSVLILQTQQASGGGN